MRIRVLIVDDEPAIATQIADVLAGQGMDTRVVRTAAEVLPAIMAFIPDVVLLDVSLPDGNGAELEPEIAERFAVPVILTADSGFDAPKHLPLLRKPYTTDELLRTIRRVLV